MELNKKYFTIFKNYLKIQLKEQCASMNLTDETHGISQNWTGIILHLREAFRPSGPVGAGSWKWWKGSVRRAAADVVLMKYTHTHTALFSGTKFD